MADLFLISNLKTSLTADLDRIRRQIAESVGVPVDHVDGVRIVKESLDARKKGKPFFVRQVEFQLTQTPASLPGSVRRLERSTLDIPDPAFHRPSQKPPRPVIVVGAGPAGMFAALTLAEAGIPVILLERGKPVETRMRDIGQLRSKGDLDPESNVCFGEGGAGAYTDGKLYTRIKHPHVRWVMRRFVDFQAPEQILVDAHPHLGTDKLVKVVKSMREHLIGLGVDIRFQTRVDHLQVREGRCAGVVLADGTVLESDHVVLGIGHSARDTLSALVKDGVNIEAKPFAVGVRAEHPQAMIDRNQYGMTSRPQELEAAAYRLTHQVVDPDLGQRGVYSFCMCPGGFVVPSPTEPNLMAVNGMSNANRSTPYANSGIVVQVDPNDLLKRGYREDPLIGIAFQRDLERRAFEASPTPYGSPAMRVSDFIHKKPSGTLAPTHFRPSAEVSDLWEVLPHWIAKPLREGLIQFGRKIKGYDSAEANLLAVESRTSSPVRLTRDENLTAVGMPGLYPIGEGAGYAGGIVSAAVDGVKAAEVIAKLLDS